MSAEGETARDVLDAAVELSILAREYTNRGSVHEKLTIAVDYLVNYAALVALNEVVAQKS